MSILPILFCNDLAVGLNGALGRFQVLHKFCYLSVLMDTVFLFFLQSVLHFAEIVLEVGQVQILVQTVDFFDFLFVNGKRLLGLRVFSRRHAVDASSRKSTFYACLKERIVAVYCVLRLKVGYLVESEKIKQFFVDLLHFICLLDAQF